MLTGDMMFGHSDTPGWLKLDSLRFRQLTVEKSSFDIELPQEQTKMNSDGEYHATGVSMGDWSERQVIVAA